MKTLRWAFAVVVAAVLLLGSYLAWKVFFEMPGPPKTTLSDRPECGHDWPDSIKVVQVKDIINIPEFHDCQRFVVKAGATYKYDSTFAIFVSQTISSLGTRLATPKTLAQLVAIPAVRTRSSGTSTTVPQQPGPTVLNTGTNASADSAGNATAAMVAVVYADGPYSVLGIATGLNCLYVWRYLKSTSSSDELWFARMVQMGTTATSCPDVTVATMRAMGPGKDLNVSRVKVAGFTNAADYPPVTRWDWDSAHDKQYIGVACDVAWCEIYDGQLTSSPPLPVSSSDPVEVRRVRSIKGWYDQQFLATFDASGKPVPSRIMGTIVPDPNLGNLNDDSIFEQHGWVHVADISLDAPDAEKAAVQKYTNKFNFVKTPITDPITLELKHKPSAPMWEARIKRPGLAGWLTLKYKNVMRRAVGASPGTYPVPGVARWRWMKTDEGSWVRCTYGCCEMSDY